MDTRTREPDSAGLYVIRLFCVPRDTGLHGRLEHVLSGRQHDFDSVEALLDCLHHEQRQVQRERGPGPGEAGAPQAR